MKYARIVGNLLVLLMMMFIITACKSQGGELLFETVAKSNGPDNLGLTTYREEEPALLIIANGDEVDALVPNVLAEAPTLADQLRQLDYDRFLAVLVLQGLKAQGGYSVTVQRIVQQDDQINVYVEFNSPEPGTRRIQAFTSPYHLVAVSKRGGEWGQQLHFMLITDSEEVAETSHFIP